jgi:hypothetical protein
MALISSEKLLGSGGFLKNNDCYFFDKYLPDA